MGIFNMFGEQEHRVFDYKPIYYDKEKDELRSKFGTVDGSRDAKVSEDKEKGTYVPGSYIQGSLRDGNYQRTRSSSTKAQNIIGLVGLVLVFVILYYIAKYYSYIQI